MVKYLEDRDFKSNFKKYFSNGIETISLSSWKDFQQIKEIFERKKDYYIWRGQLKDWQLKSTFDRDANINKLVTFFGDRNKILRKLLQEFKNQLKDLKYDSNEIKKINFKEENSFWVIGQEFGLPTPLLDWTEDPDISAYFAFYEKDSDEQINRVIYALHKEVKLHLRVIKIKDKNNNIISKEKARYVDIIVDRQILRSIRQKGLFTKALDGKDIETSAVDFFKKKSKKSNTKSEVILTKILIPNKYRKECLQSLKLLGITHGFLFPDFAGAVNICINELGLKNIKREQPVKSWWY
jgi:hypothetical protein